MGAQACLSALTRLKLISRSLVPARIHSELQANLSYSERPCLKKKIDNLHNHVYIKTYIFRDKITKSSPICIVFFVGILEFMVLLYIPLHDYMLWCIIHYPILFHSMAVLV